MLNNENEFTQKELLAILLEIRVEGLAWFKLLKANPGHYDLFEQVKKDKTIQEGI